MANTPAKKITYDNKPVQVESAIRDGTGLEIASNYLKIQGGGTSKSYTISATGYKTIAQVTSASQYWTVNGGNSHIRLKIEYSSLSSPASTATTTKLGEWIVDVTFSGINANMFAVSMNGNAGNNDGVLRYLAAYAPKSTSYGPKIAVANYSATSTYVKVTIISCTAGWELPASFGGDPGTTNYTRVGAWEIGRYNGTWSSSQIKASISGNCDGIAGSTWDSIRNDRHVGGATAAFVNGSTSYSIRSTRPCGIASDGKAYQLSTPGKAFKLPFVGGRAQNNFGLNNTGVQLYYEVRAIATSELTTQYVDNTAALTAGATYTGTGTLYAYKWVFVTHGSTDTTATTLTVGLPMYICGNLDSNGNFVPYNTVQTGQTISVPSGQGGFSAATNVKGYVYTFYITQNPTYRSGKYDTFLYFGRCDKQNNNYTWLINTSAITLNSDGKLTHIDGKAVAESGNMKYTDQSVSFTANSDAYSTDYPYRATLTSPGTTATSYATVTYSGAQVSSGNYAPFCRTDADVVYLYAKTNVGTQVIPTISVGTDGTDLTRQPISADIVARTLTLVSSSNTEVSGYPYKYSFPCAGASAQSTADVTFGLTDAASGVWAPICDTGANVIYIYAKSAQSSCSAGYQLYYSDSAVTLTPSGNVGSDTKPVKIVGGQVEAVAKDLIQINSSSNVGSIPSWGTLTGGNGYTHSWGVNQNSGELIAASKDGQMSMQVDGYFYQREGSSRCIDTTDISAGYVQSNLNSSRNTFIRSGYVSNSSTSVYLFVGSVSGRNAPDSVVVTPRYAGSNRDFPSKGWVVSRPAYNSSPGGYYVYVYHDSGIIEGWYWIAIWH